MPKDISPFTHAALERIQPPADGRLWVRNARTPGMSPALVLCVTPTGTKTWYINRQCGEKGDRTPRKVRIGPFPDLSPAQANAEALKQLADIARGIDPVKEKVRARAERDRTNASTTFAEAFERFKTEYAEPHQLRTWSEYQRRYDKKIPAEWKARTLDDITSEDVRREHGRLGKRIVEKKGKRTIVTNGPIEANRVLMFISAVYTKGAGRTGDRNPAYNIPKFPETKRVRFLNNDEASRLNAALDDAPRPFIRDAVLLMLLTGQRKSEVLGARWETIDLRRATWTIPTEDFKGKREHHVRLAPPALDVFRKRKAAAAPGDEYVFQTTSRGDGTPTPCVILHREWKAVLDKAKIRNFHIHDLRHTFGSWHSMGGHSLQKLQALLGHQDVRTTDRYSHLLPEATYAGMDDTSGRLMLALGNGGQHD